MMQHMASEITFSHTVNGEMITQYSNGDIAMLTATQNFTTLKAIPLADRDAAQVLNRAVDGDNGGGLFRYDALATNPDDDGLIGVDRPASSGKTVVLQRPGRYGTARDHLVEQWRDRPDYRAPLRLLVLWRLADPVAQP